MKSHQRIRSVLMTQILAIAAGALLIGASLSTDPARAAENRKSASANPNIIFILADDQGFGDVSALNPKSRIPTPNIDRIANENRTVGSSASHVRSAWGLPDAGHSRQHAR